MALPQWGPGVPLGVTLYTEGLQTPLGDVFDMAQELLQLGVLRESDWAGDVEKSMDRGLSRWVNTELGANKLHFLAPMQLVYGNDARSYFAGRALHDTEWRNQLKAVEHRPIGFFAFKWDIDGHTPVYVADKVLELEAVSKGLGYGLLAMIQFAFRWCCSGVGFEDGYNNACDAEGELYDEYMESESYNITPDATEEEINQLYEEFENSWPDTLDGCDDTILSTRSFARHIPEEAYEAKFDRDAVQRACKAIEITKDKKKYKYAFILKKSLDLQHLINRSTRTHVGCSHLALLRKDSHPSIYLRWNEHDQMERIVDDLSIRSEYDQSGGFSWFHGFQLDHGGALSGMADTQKYLADAVGFSAFPQFAPDGTLAAAVDSVRQAVLTMRALDDVLQWLHSPEAHMQPQTLLQIYAQEERIRVRV